MPHPKKRKSNAKTNMRRSHHALKSTQTISCTQCKSQILPHTVCSNCGYYKGKEVVGMAPKTEKKDKK